MLGMMLQAAALRRAVIVDGFVAGSAALVVWPSPPICAAFCSQLGEGSGSVLAAPMLKAAATLREMLTFEEARVPDGAG